MGQLHSLVKNVNMQAAMDRVRRLAGKGQPTRTLDHGVGFGHTKSPDVMVDPRMPRHPEGVPGAGEQRGGPGSIADFIARERAMTQLGPGFAANPNLGMTMAPPGGMPPDFMPPPQWQDPQGDGGVNPYPDGVPAQGPPSWDEQRAVQQRQAMIARLMASGRMR